MSIDVHTIPRATVNGYLHLVRVPVDTLARITRHTDAAWGPTVMADTFEARVRTTVGRLLRDDELVEQGELGDVRVRKLTEAAELEADAQERRREADDELSAKEQHIRDTAERAERTADERESQAKEALNEKEQKIRQEADKLKHQAAKETAHRDQLIADKQAEADKRRLATEREVLAEKRKAVAGKKQATAVAKAARKTNQARKASRT